MQVNLLKISDVLLFVLWCVMLDFKKCARGHGILKRNGSCVYLIRVHPQKALLLPSRICWKLLMCWADQAAVKDRVMTQRPQNLSLTQHWALNNARALREQRRTEKYYHASSLNFNAHDSNCAWKGAKIAAFRAGTDRHQAMRARGQLWRKFSL